MQIRDLIMQEMGLLLQKTSKQHLIDCRKALDLSEVTIHKYIVGNGSKIDIYQNIINYLRNVA